MPHLKSTILSLDLSKGYPRPCLSVNVYLGIPWSKLHQQHKDASYHDYKGPTELENFSKKYVNIQTWGLLYSSRCTGPRIINKTGLQHQWDRQCFECIISLSSEYWEESGRSVKLTTHLLTSGSYMSEGLGFDSRWCHWIFSWPISSSRILALGLTQPLTEMSTKNLPGSKGRLAGT
jgi:hypothetical protein